MRSHPKTYWNIAAVIALLIVAGIALYMIYQPSNSPVLAYVQVKEVDPDGNLARGGSTDTLQVMIYPPTEAFTHHYQLSENLKLYGEFTPDELQLFYSPQIDQYFLEIDGQRYVLQRSDNVTKLE